jgi:type I restriction enzyme S subunit
MLPPGWARVEIKDLISAGGVFVDGDWVESKDQDPEGDVRLIQLADIGEGAFLDKSARFLTSAKADELRCTFLKKGDVLVARMPDPLGRACIFPLEGDNRFVTVVDVCIIRTSSEVASPEFLTSAINFLGTRKQIEDLQTGTTRKRISRGNLAHVTIPLPPLAEQKRIVAKIEELFSELEAGEESLRVARRQLGVYRQSLLKQAFEGKLTAQWRTQNPAKLESPAQLITRILALRRSGWMGKGNYSDPAPFAEGVFDQLPKDWRMLSLEAATSAARPICYGILMPKENVAAGVLYVKVRDMKGDRIDLSGLQRTSPEIAAQYARASLREGDLLLSIRGTYGRIAVIPKELDGGNITQDSARLAISSLMSRDFVRWAIRSQQIQHYFKRVARGVAVKGVNIGDVRPTPIPLPSLPEQLEIVRLLDAQFEVIERNERELDAALKRSEALRQAILKKAFTGRLVPQVATDEPASTLLARLRTERAAAPASKRKPTLQP